MVTMFGRVCSALAKLDAWQLAAFVIWLSAIPSVGTGQTFGAHMSANERERVGVRVCVRLNIKIYRILKKVLQTVVFVCTPVHFRVNRRKKQEKSHCRRKSDRRNFLTLTHFIPSGGPDSHLNEMRFFNSNVFCLQPLDMIPLKVCWRYVASERSIILYNIN